MLKTSTIHSLDQLLDELKHPQVRDLAWAIGSPHLVDQADQVLRHQAPSLTSLGEDDSPLRSTSSVEWTSLHITPTLTPQAELVRCTPALLALDHDPGHLLDSLAAQRANYPRVRLGVYFEHLITYWLSALVGADPLYRELQIYEPQARGVKTLGALDLVGKFDQDQATWTHIEVATKFYLEREDAPRLLTSNDTLDQSDMTSWVAHPWMDQVVGPNERDSLGHKLRRLLRHQLPMSDHPRARDLLRETGVDQVNQRLLWLKGRLFKWAGDASGHLMTGLWVRAGQLQLISRHLGSRVKALCCAKPSWLAPPLRTELDSAPVLTMPALEAQARSTKGERGATLWYLASLDLAEHRWVMIVPDDWCDRR